MPKNRNAKVYRHSSKTLFTRKGNKVTTLETGKTEEHKSINKAKKQTRALVDKHGLGSVMLVK